MYTICAPKTAKGDPASKNHEASPSILKRRNVSAHLDQSARDCMFKV